MTNLQHRLWLILPVAAIAPPLFAATFTVTTTNISGPGSLPAVIAQANATPGSHVIRFGVTNVITLGLQLPAITNSVTIIGRADVPTVISGGGTFSLFSFSAGTVSKLSRLVLANGSTAGNGAAINNSGELHVESCILTNHHTIGGSGGAAETGVNSSPINITINNRSANQPAWDSSFPLLLEWAHDNGFTSLVVGEGGTLAESSTEERSGVSLGAELF